jgi:nitronate monooxygenase
MLAGVGYVLMGAGIPLHIPGVLDALRAPCGRVQAGGDRARKRRIRTRRCASIRPICRGPASSAAPAQVSGHRLLEHAGHHHAAPGQRPRRRFGDREPDGGRTQCAAARQAAAERRRRAGLWRARSGEHSRSCARWAFPSGWRAAMATRKSCARRWSRARRACRWEPRLPSAGNPGMRPDLKKRLIGPGVAGSGRGVYRSAGLADGISVQGCAARRHVFRVRRLSGAEAGLRSGLSARAVRRADGNIGYRCSAEPVEITWPRAARSRRRWPQVPVQCADGQYRPRADAQGRLR